MTGGQRTLLIVVGIVFLVVLVPFLYLKSTYNGLVTMDEGVKGAWAQVENQLQRRYDLIPNYVETVKGYAQHEKEVFLKVAEARSRVAGAWTIREKIGANNQLSSALARLLLVVERYPDLKANANFQQLQAELSDIENKIAAARRSFNNTVQEYNTSIEQFPASLFAGALGFRHREFFDLGETRPQLEQAPSVKF